MQINGISNTPVVPLLKSTSSTAPSASDETDSATLSNSADSFSSYVQVANQYPEVRSELVDSFKSRIQSGHYPAQEVIAGLTRMIGGPIMQMASSGSSAGSLSDDSSSGN